jgi:CRISPR-associated exonuclease Cas4
MVSATQLSSYLYCPRKLFLSNVLLVEEPIKAELVLGTIWHQTYESLNNSEESIVTSIATSNYQEIFDIYRHKYSKILRDVILKNKSKLKEFNTSMIDVFNKYWPNFEEEAKEHALNISSFISKHKIFGKELWNELTPKILSEQYFKSKKLNLSGVIDVIEIHENKFHVPIELKTGKFPEKGMWDGHRIQLAAYMLLLDDAGKNVNEAVMKYRGTDKRILSMNSFLKEEVLDLINKTSTVLNSLEVPKYVDNKNKCKSCQFKDTCYDQDAIKKLLADATNRLKTSKK